MNIDNTDYREQVRQKFVNHKATIVLGTDRFTSIDWRNENGGAEYYINYTLDKEQKYLYISGDLGECIANFYGINDIDFEKIAETINNDADYFISRFCTSTDTEYYDAERILKLALEELESSNPNLIEDYLLTQPTDIMTRDDVETAILEDIENNMFEDDTIFDVYGNFPIFEQIDYEFRDWLPYVAQKGIRIFPKVYYWVEGLCESVKQLKKEETE